MQLGNVSIAAGNLAITTLGNLTQAANTSLAVGGTTSLEADFGGITLNQANAFTGAVSLTTFLGLNVAVNNNQSLVLGNVSIDSVDLAISTRGNITQAEVEGTNA